MKKKILVIYDYERIVPPFLQTLIKIWVNRFDEIKYVTPPMPAHYNLILNNPKIEIITWSRTQRVKQFIKGVLSILRPAFWKEANKGIITKSVIANIGKLFFCSDGFIDLSKQVIKKNLEEDNEVYLLATWLAAEAFTAARVKNKYPSIKAFVLAHSGEVIKERNPYMHQSFHEFIFENVNRVFFISKNVLNNYYQDMNDISLEKRFGDKIAQIYLGSLKDNNSMNPEDTAGCIQILSCSRVDANKRLDRIISTLSKWEGSKIKWTHIGAGELEQEVKDSADELSKRNPNVEVIFTGRLDNSKVIDYYSKNHIDLFINVSKSEGLPISIMEAMSYGIPCVATNVGGTSEIVNESNGFLLEPDFSDEELVLILGKFTKLNGQQRKNLKENSFQTWKNKFNAETNAINMYNCMVNS